MCDGDGLPAQVCRECVHKVATAYDFKLLCERSDAKLRGYMKNRINIFSSQLSEVSRLSKLNITSVFRTNLQYTYVCHPQNIKPIYNY
jgi:hypothetical protein